MQTKEKYTILSKSINTDGYKTIVTIYKPKSTIKNILFLLHGTPLDQTCVFPLTYAFINENPNLAVITYDIRGHGSAFKTPMPFIANDANATENATNAYTQLIYQDFLLVKNMVYPLLTLKSDMKYILCGWSFGGICAQSIAIADPSMVKALGIISSVGKGRIAAQPILDSLIQYENGLQNLGTTYQNNLYVGIEPTIVQANLDKWFDTEFINSDIYLKAQQIVQGSSIQNYINTYSTIVHFDLSTLWKDESYPVFIFSAPDDPVGTPQLEKDIYTYITSARNDTNKKSVILFNAPDGKHAKCIEDPDLVVKNMCSFIRSF
jgi:pimeloyl-ACP methyl ester carboxylesterase